MSFCDIWCKTIQCSLRAQPKSLEERSPNRNLGSWQEIANDIEMVLAADTLEVQNEQQVYDAVVALRNGTGTFEDALIGSLGIWRGCSATLTFDEQAAQRLHGFALA